MLNRAVGERLGGVHSARLLLASADFAEVEAMQRDGAWDEAAAPTTRLHVEAAVDRALR